MESAETALIGGWRVLFRHGGLSEVLRSQQCILGIGAPAQASGPSTFTTTSPPPIRKRMSSDVSSVGLLSR
jgi:hypothetical protein